MSNADPPRGKCVRIDLTGNTYGRLIVVDFHSSDGRRVKWNCKCSCGNTCVTMSDNLKNGSTQSCGCLQTEVRKSKATKHDHYYHPLFGRYKQIRSRCYVNSNKSYLNYGGRGIKVCDRWLESFDNFLEDMGESFSVGSQIDRVDVDGDYEPSNCRWVTPQQNSFNTRSRGGSSEYKGVSLSKRDSKWRAQIVFNGKCYNLGAFEDEDDAARAYNQKAIDYFGEYAVLNDIRGDR